MTSKYRAADLSRARTIPFANRANKVSIEQFAARPDWNGFAADPLSDMPDVLAARDLRAVADAIVAAHRAGRAVVFMLGGHVVKTGCSPLLTDLLQRKVITHLAMNGATAIHDYEIARFGQTSEDVAENLADATFGMVDETGQEMNDAFQRGQLEGWGMGEALARSLLESGAAHADVSLLVAAYEADVPVSVHVAVGAEIVHQHPSCRGAALGETSFTDFRVLIESLTDLGDGGVVLNLGSAVILPEVFLKALTLARNLGNEVNDFTAVNLDMIRHYRPEMNVIGRPVQTGGRGIHIAGHHEVMIPLLYRAVAWRLGGD
ncbi:MAG: hypothetical protein GWN99_02585 [Gemmatimonadetes bacterium]|uniref:Deoxyhypusine synthase n=1 Tax=Candidatus Kutchimonas denitrificans TaxID=3056748 RepID=A0AAE4Z9A1_9BACT|nr:hypothetical protein [Gemmatimonadota bacterium]NIR74842.1 hypothetical protein [Candidatus Kutchimonas denitrificans]NIR99953.1 hypothetical protein [Gemmatimonadota bacterium]NIT65537.1 hypothetical protein [Gemmatimonadota bacterium]NIU52507.1 hypothetical protein [Gemmatimonadota bacterium]